MSSQPVAALDRRLPPGYRGFPLAFWIIISVIFTSFVGLGVILPVRVLYAQQVGLTLAEISVMGSAFFLSQFIFQVPLGMLADRIGRKWTLQSGLLLQALAAGVYLVNNEPWVFIGMRFIEGIGAAAQQPAARAYIADVVPEAQRGRAYGIYRAAFQGGLLAGPALGGLLAGLGGFEIAYYVNGFARLSGFLLVLFLVIEPRREGGRAVTRRAQRPTAGAAVVAVTANVPDVPAGAPAAARRESAVSIPLLAAYIVGLGVNVFNGIDASIWAIYLKDLGASLTYIGATYTLRAATAMLLTPVCGALADRYNRPLLVLLAGAVSLLTTLVLGLERNLVVIMAATLCQGLALALALPPIDRYLADHSPRRYRARVQSIFQTMNGASAGLMALAAGALYEANPCWPFLILTVVIGVTVCGGALTMLAVQRRSGGDA